ncbi:hypothetical protein BHE90_014829 [Fusarium euwallaceae]|uniref:CCHC-type domain-containing protein n=1 Tax=Fusarium euwallaceae TaxID=1147111 RepID=A0A430L4V4_9HYPO|nr:hypothetical protein BHE90_014829 [Fusarium euwallaceae]
MHVGADMADIVSKEVFRMGLVGAAARWYEDFEPAEKTWDTVKRAFYLRLQERVWDRLYADGKWGKSAAMNSLTFNDVRDMIWECRSSTSEKLVRGEEDTIPASEMDPVRIWLRQQEMMTELAQQLKDHTVLTTKRIDLMENAHTQTSSGNNRSGDQRPAYTPPTMSGPRPQQSAPRNDNPDFYWCFKCGEWGHMGYNCALGNQFDRNEYRRRQEEWMANKGELCRQRAEQLAQPSVPTAKTLTWSGAVNFRPPPGYRPSLFSGQTSETVYRWTQDGLTKTETPTTLSHSLRDPPVEPENHCRTVVMAARSEKPKDPKRRETTRPTDENMLREIEIQARESLGNTRVEYQSPRVEDMEDAERSPPQEETIVVAPSRAGSRESAVLLLCWTGVREGVDLVNERYVEELQIPRLMMPVPGQLRMANDQVQRVGSCVYLRVVVGGILATVKAYVLGNHDDWDVLVGRPWLRRMRAVEDHYDDKLVVKGQKGHYQAIPIFPTPNLFEPDERGRAREPIRLKPMLRCDGDEEIIFVDDDLPILEEVEDILGELGGEIFATAGKAYRTSGN